MVAWLEASLLSTTISGSNSKLFPVNMNFGRLRRKKTPIEAFLNPFSSSLKSSRYSWAGGNTQPCRSSRTYRVNTTTKRRVISGTAQHTNEGDEDPIRIPEQGKEERRFKYKFDPHSDVDAFGRDPRKETEFWMDAAKNVLESDEVQKAIADHAAEGGDGLTDEQRQYMEFIKGLDQESG